jgi:hypothetical protein
VNIVESASFVHLPALAVVAKDSALVMSVPVSMTNHICVNGLTQLRQYYISPAARYYTLPPPPSPPFLNP